MEANGKLLNNSVLKTEDTHPKRGYPFTLLAPQPAKRHPTNVLTL